MKSAKPIAVASRTFSRHPVLRARLEELFSNIMFNDQGLSLKDEDLVKFLSGKEGAIIALEPITENVLSKLPQLKVISKFGVGLDNLDLNAMKKYSVRLGWSGGVNKRGVSELSLFFMLGLLRSTFSTSREFAAGKWNNVGGVQLSAKTVGIIGCGHIGKDLVELLKPFGCKILINDLLDVSDFCRKNGAVCADKEQIWKEADVVSLHVPFDGSTKNLIDAAVLSKMKPTAVLVNTSRGNIVDEQALFTALKEKKIAAAAADVFAVEPLTASPLQQLMNFTGTAHVGGSSAEAVLAMGMSAIENLKEE